MGRVTFWQKIIKKPYSINNLCYNSWTSDNDKDMENTLVVNYSSFVIEFHKHSHDVTLYLNPSYFMLVSY